MSRLDEGHCFCSAENISPPYARESQCETPKGMRRKEGPYGRHTWNQ